jgi:hypothetical protein
MTARSKKQVRHQHHHGCDGVARLRRSRPLRTRPSPPGLGSRLAGRPPRAWASAYSSQRNQAFTTCFQETIRQDQPAFLSFRFHVTGCIRHSMLI